MSLPCADPRSAQGPAPRMSPRVRGVENNPLIPYLNRKASRHPMSQPSFHQSPITMTALPDPHNNPALYAGVPSKRLLAWVVDMAVTLGMTLVFIPLTLFTALFYLPFLWLVVGFLYRWMTLANRSATWGMRFAAIELRGPDGGRFDNGQAFFHTLGYFVSFAVAPLQLISIVLMLISERKQGLTDHVMGTAMLNRASEW